jgi:hypothetical protein
MSELESHIKRVNDKLQQLLKKYESAQKENQRLIKDLNDKKEKHQTSLKQIDTLQEQVSILKAATSKMEDADKKEFEKRINQYIKSVDKCIGLLSE